MGSVALRGGHVDLPVTSPRDFALWQGLQARYGHVSAERALSGNGLLALYEISCALDGVAVRASSAAEVGALAMAGDAQADAVLERFFLWLARVAGNAVLTVGALGGVYITGGIVPRFLERFIASGFAEAFASRGKTSGAYLGRTGVGHDRRTSGPARRRGRPAAGPGRRGLSRRRATA